MFGWLRHWWHGGQIPQKPADDLLDFPEEEKWVFDSDAWKWRAQEIPYNPRTQDEEEFYGDEEVTELDAVEEEVKEEAATHESRPLHGLEVVPVSQPEVQVEVCDETRCCGRCKLDQPQ